MDIYCLATVSTSKAQLEVPSFFLTMSRLVDESVEEDVQQVTEEGESMDVSEEHRLLRAAALNSRNQQISPLKLIPPGPAGNSLSPAPGGPSLPAGGAPAPSVTRPALGTGSQDELVKIILNQQRQLEQAGVRPRAQPAPGFQIFAQQQLPSEAQQVSTSASLRLGAQLAQLQLGTEQSEVSVLRANQLVMQANLLDHNGQQQRAAAEKKVGLSSV